MSNPATAVQRGTALDERIPGLPVLPAGTNRTTLTVPVYNPATDKTEQTPLVAGDGATTSNAVVGSPKLVRYRSSQLYGVPADALTLDRLTPATIVPGTTATVDNPSDTPLSTTLPAKQYVATRTAAGTAGAVVVPAYIGAAAGDTVSIIWQEVAAGGGGAGTVTSVNGVGPDATGNVQVSVSGGNGYTDTQAQAAAAVQLLAAVQNGVSITQDATTKQLTLTNTAAFFGRFYFSTPAPGTGNLVATNFPVVAAEQGVYQWAGDGNVAAVDMSYAGGQFSGSLADFKLRTFSLLDGQQYAITLTPIDVNAYTYLDLRRIG